MNRAASSSAVESKERLVELEGRTIPDQMGGFDSLSEAEEISSLRSKLLAAARSVCPYWPHDDQQDIVQVAMIAVVKQQKKIEGNRRFPLSYLRQAAYTAMVDEIRRRRSRGEVPLEAEDGGEMPLVEEGAGPERLVMAGEISIGVRGCLDRLAAPRRAAVTLRLLGYKVPLIAQRMGWKGKQAENLVYRGMQNLRECLRERGLQP